MGALLGMVDGGATDTPVSRLVVNDAGPLIEPAAVARIRDYLGLAPTFATMAEADAYIRAVSAPFGALTDAQWDHLTRTSVAQNAEGRYALTYDPGIAVPFQNAAAPPDLWPVWDAIRCPTLVLRGAQSDLLSAATAQAMTARGPKPAAGRIPRRRPCADAPFCRSDSLRWSLSCAGNSLTWPCKSGMVRASAGGLSRVPLRIDKSAPCRDVARSFAACRRPPSQPTRPRCVWRRSCRGWTKC